MDGKYTDATADILSSLKSDDEDSDSDTEDCNKPLLAGT